jgi:hypothetical protein
MLNTIAIHSQSSSSDSSYEGLITTLLSTTILLVKLYPSELAHLHNNILHMLVFPILASS